MRALALLSAAAFVATPVAAQSAKPPCLTAGEFTAMSSYALPSIITGARDRCAKALPADAWLQRNGDELAQRYAAGKPAAWPDAKAAFLKIGGNAGNAQTGDVLRSLPDSSLQPMLDALIAGMIGQSLPTERCTTVDRAVRLLAPLPPENTAELIALAAGLGARSGRASAGGFSLCAA